MPSQRGIRRSISTTSGSCAAGERDRLLAVGRGADQLDPVEQPEQRAEALAHDALVVGEQDADHAGSHSSTRKPSPVGPALQPAAEQLGALAHAGQPVAAAALGRPRDRRARPVVLDHEPRAVVGS